MSKGARDRGNAKRIVEQQRLAERRRLVMIWTSAAVAAVLVVSGLVGWAVYSSQHNATTNASSATPAVAVDGGTAFAIGTGPVTVDLYEDFMCPICHEFETATGPTVKELVADNKITVRYHPVAILDSRSNGTNYSTRSAGAAAAAAQGGKFLQFHDALYANQPEENSNGLTDAKLIEIGQDVGLSDDAFANAVKSRTYDSWATKATDTFSSRGYHGTPTVVVAGKMLTHADGGIPTPDDLTAAVSKAAG